MGALVNHRITTFIAWIIAALVIILNIFLLYQTFVGYEKGYSNFNLEYPFDEMIFF